MDIMWRNRRIAQQIVYLASKYQNEMFMKVEFSYGILNAFIEFCVCLYT